MSLCVPLTSLTQWQHIARLDFFSLLASIHMHEKYIQLHTCPDNKQPTESCQCITSNDQGVYNNHRNSSAETATIRVDEQTNVTKKKKKSGRQETYYVFSSKHRYTLVSFCIFFCLNVIIRRTYSDGDRLYIIAPTVSVTLILQQKYRTKKKKKTRWQCITLTGMKLDSEGLNTVLMHWGVDHL